jgi:hypothetical protein
MEYDYYILKMYGLVDPGLFGPYTESKCAEILIASREDPKENQNSFIEIKITKGAEIEL